MVSLTTATADRRAIVDVLTPQIVEKIVEVVEIVSKEWISERICECALLNKSWLFLCLDSGTKCTVKSKCEI